MTKATLKWVCRLIAKILTVLLYAATIVSAYGGYFNPTWWTLPAIGVLFFPYIAMTTLAVSAIWLFRKKYIIGCVGIGVLLASGPTFPQALPFRFGNSSADQSKTFKMVTFNCLHMQDIKNPEVQKGSDQAPELNRSLEFLINSGADFICLQELYIFGPPEIAPKYKKQIDRLHKIYPYFADDGSREVNFASKYPFQQVEVKLDDDVKYGSCAAYRMKIDGKQLTVINVHLPSYLLSPEERNIITGAGSQKGIQKSIEEFEGSIYHKMRDAFEMRAHVAMQIAEFAEKEEGNVIVCGDFNDVPGSWTYRIFTTRGFEDAYAQTGFGHMITYNSHLMWFHIDQILYKGALVPLYVRKERMNASDHYPLVAEFEFI